MRAIFLLLMLALTTGSFAQCTSVINTFPHFQDFETSGGGWVVGGTASDWSYGTPAKSIISGAGSGAKSWMAGGLSGSAYASGENSWLMSPCYDLSSLSAPMVRFKVFWETEMRWDGASMDYSTDGGNTWTKAGSVTDSNNCTTSNWFNFPSINNVGQGWSGSIKPTTGSCLGGGGSGKWVTAQHQFLNLAGKTSVRFRFTFTAGTTCNNFDGFAIDDFTVLNTPPPSADFEFTCAGNQTISFNALYNCPVVYEWNFGDAASGTYNFAFNKAPTHTFSAPGSYTVSLSVTAPSGQVVVADTVVSVLGATASVTKPISCHNGADGAINANGAGLPPGSNYSFEWNTSPPKHVAAINNLAAGTYTVTVSSANTCPATAAVVLANPQMLSDNITLSYETCGQKNGAAVLHETGGTAPYTYNWQPAVSTSDSAGGLAAGDYVVFIKDAHQCGDTVEFAIQNINSLALQVDAIKHVSCFGGNDGSAIVNARGGINGFRYDWQPYGGVASIANDLGAGKYTVTVTDGSGCSQSASINILQPPVLKISLGPDLAICPGANLPITPGNFAAYTWQDSSHASSYFLNRAGTYWVSVVTDKGCTASDTIRVIEDCHDIVFPNAFTPNKDGRNDVFRPLGTLNAMTEYRLSVFNRWGQLVFKSTDPTEGWNGRFKTEEMVPGVYVWMAEFSFIHQPKKLMKGTVVLMR